ncbi:MAG TPA: Vms1/Ankzf1 family peptidyl-tRNA hydrolase [Blastococcus sp.]|nr:Vms1/Ankzf1 family peptidyl-tRNA hydrolase [Blastococcus sp.]
MPLLAHHAPVRADTIRTLFEAPGPWASVYLGLSGRDARGVPVDRAVRRHALSDALTHQGAPADVTAALDDAAEREPPGPAVLAAFAPEAGPVRLFRVAGLETPDVAEVGPLPRVLPLLGWLQEHPPHVVVVTDRTGADVEAAANGTELGCWTVVGPDDEIERNAPGGWAQGRYQHRAEDSWRHNAASVAEAVVSAVRESGARLVVVAGDVRAVQLLEERLPAGVRRQVALLHLGGGRSPDGSQRDRAERVDALTRAFVAGESDALLRRFDEERAPGGVGVDGVPATLEAISRGDVEDLLLVPPALEGRTAWFGPRASDVLLEENGQPPGWDGPAVRAPLADVVVRAVLGTGGEVRLVPHGLPTGPAEGMGAFCRYR